MTEFRVLGPLEVVLESGPAGLRGRKQRALLALLLLNANHVVSTDTLIDALWGETPPRTAVPSLQNFIAHLRKLLGPETLTTQDPGYVLHVEPSQIDLERFCRIVETVRGKATEERIAALREALDLWRGEPLAEFRYDAWAETHIARLEELRLATVEDLFDALVDAGRAAELVPELEGLVAQHPLRERLRGQLMLALYRSGRQAEALDVYQDVRRRLVEELGIAPGPRLQQLNGEILRQEVPLELPEARPGVGDIVAEVVKALRAESLLPQTREPSDVHRKVVTVLFCDVVGSTELGESLDPEALQALLARYYERMKAIAESHGGSVEKFIGDAVMAVFGVPQVHEDDALRAVRAAAVMRDAFPEVGVEGRIGIDTGEVVTGTPERLATGDAVNIAARLEQAARPNEILLGETTNALVASAVDVEDIAPLALRGHARPVPAFRLVGVLDAPERAPTTPFVGRDEELEQLRDSWRRALADKRCELVTIVGEAGVGKSRLVAEFVAGLDARVVHGRCLPYGDGITYSPVVDVLKQLGSLPADPAAAAPLRALLGRSDAATSAEAIAWGFRKLLEEQSPLVVLFDDVQWGAETFLDLIDHLALLSTGAPLLVLCLARPELLELRHDWTATSHLEPLGASEVDELIGGRVPAELRERIAHAAGGNPLFVIEMLAMVESAGSEISVPPSLRALLAARIDQLDVHERRVLECAAVEGELFHRGAVQALAPDEEEITRLLAALTRRRLVRPDTAQLPGEDGFRFRHLLIRDAAYDALPKATRAELHERFADWLEHHADSVAELDEILGYHLEQAARFQQELGRSDPELAARAGERLARAGRRAMFRADHGAVEGLLERSLALTRPLRMDVALELDLAKVKRTPEERVAVVEAVARRAAEVGDKAGEAVARVVAAEERALLGGCSVDDLDALTRAALPLLEEADDHAALVHLWYELGEVANMRGRFEDATRADEEATRHARLAGQTTARQSNLPLALVHGPRPADAALRTFDANLPEPTPGQALMRAWLLAMLGRFEEAWALAREMGKKIEEYTGEPWGEFVLAEIAALADDHDAAAAHLQTHCDMLERLGRRGNLATYAPQLGRELCALGRHDEAEPLARLGRELGDEDDIGTQMLWRQAQSLVTAHHGECAEAERLAREAVAIGERTDALNWQAGALWDLAEVLVAAGRADDGAAALERVLERCERKRNLALAAQARPRLAALSVVTLSPS